MSELTPITVEEMRELCPDCADKMEARHIAALKVDLEAAAEERDSNITYVGSAPLGAEFIAELANVSKGADPRAGEGMPRQLLQGLCNDIGDVDAGFFTRCMAYRFNAKWAAKVGSNKKGFCAWLHKQCIGKWPGEKAAASATITANTLTGNAAGTGGPINVSVGGLSGTTTAPPPTFYPTQMQKVELADEVPELQTVGVKAMPIVRAGSFRAKTGPINVDEAMLRSIVAASKDPEVREPVIKIGHADGRFAEGDGNPALGWLTDLRLKDGQVYADAAGIPRKVAPLILSSDDTPAPYRRRSVEMEFNVTTPSGKKYPAVLTALALLGERAPAIANLDDVLNLYTAAGAPEGETHALLSLEDDEPETKQLRGNVVPLRHRKIGKSGGHMPDEPEQTELETEEETDVAVLLGLSEDASDEDIATKIAELVKAEEAKTAAEEAKVKAEQERDALKQKITASKEVEGETVKLSKDAHAELVEMAKAGHEARQAQLAAERDSILDQAIKDGKIKPNQRAFFEGLLSKPDTREAAAEHLGQLAPGAEFATAELGSDNGRAVHAGNKESDEELFARLYPDDPSVKKE